MSHAKNPSARPWPPATTKSLCPKINCVGPFRQAHPMAARRIPWRVPRRHWPGSLRNSATGWIPNATGSIALAAISSKPACTQSSKDALFRAAHDIKGEAATFGYPPWPRQRKAYAASSSTRPEISRIPVALIGQHVDAVRAIYREYARSDAKKLAATLTTRLREVTDYFLISENRDRPEVLKQLKGPSIVPE